MTKDSIIQFVGFTSELPHEEFLAQWETYLQGPGKSKSCTLLHLASGKTRYSYISQHEYPENGFVAAFKKNKNTDKNPGISTRVVQAGGYAVIKEKLLQPLKKNDVAVMILVDHNEHDIAGLSNFAGVHTLRIYQAYYENCLYGHILEYYLPEQQALELLNEIGKKPGVEVGVYQKCLIGARKKSMA